MQKGRAKDEGRRVGKNKNIQGEKKEEKSKRMKRERERESENDSFIIIPECGINYF